MKRYMKNNKFDFFQSPHPRTRDFYNLIKDRDYSTPFDSQNNDLHIFQTPVRVTSFSPFSSNLNNDFCSSDVTTNKKGYYDGLFLQNIENYESQDHYQQSIKQINEKLQYSEQLLVHLTPQKNAIIDDEHLQTTVKKQNYQNQATNEVKFYERGLKKLAFEAFNFVSHQKRTTYKQVAKRLINQINDENELDIQRKGEMNIKRRVYDALNVLIALGLLKRNGNKIIGKKIQSDHISLQNSIQKEKLKKKQESLLQELDHVQRECNRKIQSIRKKKKIFEELKEKSNIIKNLTTRNKSQLPNDFLAQKEFHHIQMPFIYLTLNQKEKKYQSMDIQPEKIHSRLIISQQNKQTLFCKYHSYGQIQIIGDTDLLKNINLNNTQGYGNIQRTQRIKKAKHK